MDTIADFGGFFCGISISFSLISLIMCLVLTFLSRLPNSTTELHRFSSEMVTKVHQAFLSALCFTTVGIYYHDMWPWGAWLMLVGLFACVVIFRSMDPWNRGRRVSVLMVIALQCGMSLAHLLDSAHPISPSVVICLLWTMALPFLIVQVIACRFTSEFHHFFVFVMHLSGWTILVLSYAAATLFGISGAALHFKLFFGIQICSEFLYSAIRKFIIARFADEDRDEWLFHTFYSFISFLDMTILVILFL